MTEEFGKNVKIRECQFCTFWGTRSKYTAYCHLKSVFTTDTDYCNLFERWQKKS